MTKQTTLEWLNTNWKIIAAVIAAAVYFGEMRLQVGQIAGINNNQREMLRIVDRLGERQTSHLRRRGHPGLVTDLRGQEKRVTFLELYMSQIRNSLDRIERSMAKKRAGNTD